MAMETVSQEQDNLGVKIELTKVVTVKSGETVSRGDLVSLDGDKVIPFLSGAVPYTVMLEDVDASAADVAGTAMRAGQLKASEVNFGTGYLSQVVDALDDIGIYLV
jgi:hypothetical protein